MRSYITKCHEKHGKQKTVSMVMTNLNCGTSNRVEIIPFQQDRRFKTILFCFNLLKVSFIRLILKKVEKFCQKIALNIFPLYFDRPNIKGRGLLSSLNCSIISKFPNISVSFLKIPVNDF